MSWRTNSTSTVRRVGAGPRSWARLNLRGSGVAWSWVRNHEGQDGRPEPAALSALLGRCGRSGRRVGVRYEWMSGRHFLLQHAELEQFCERITGLEVIGHLRPVGQPADTDPSSPASRTRWVTPRPRLRAGERHPHDLDWPEGSSPAYFRGNFSDCDRVLVGAWVYRGGGYDSTMTRHRAQGAAHRRQTAPSSVR